MFRSLIASAIVVTSGAWAHAAEPTPLSEQDLRILVPGSAIEIDTPLGTVVPVRFSTDGTMTGEAGKLASMLGAERDRGRWWVMGDQLCFKWFRWFDAERRCLKLSRDGNHIAWAEQGGDADTGTATIVALAEPVIVQAKKKPEPERANAVRPEIAEAPPPPPEPEPAKTQPTFANLTIISRAEAATPPAVQENDDAKPADEQAAPAVPPQKPAASVKPKPTVKAVPAKADTKPAPSSAKQRDVGRQTPAAKPAVRKATPAKPTFNEPTYQVARVEEDDVLNIRSGPSEYHAAVGAIPPAGRGVKIVGACEGDWCPITHGRAKGWVNSYYLSPEAGNEQRRAARVLQ